MLTHSLTLSHQIGTSEESRSLARKTKQKKAVRAVLIFLIAFWTVSLSIVVGGSRRSQVEVFKGKGTKLASLSNIFRGSIGSLMN
ncbi:hypothetical protein QN277_017361 [Acacia crassicarpa]|uniref:Uncharacterized protein n=1 Tax=Acacia crassicarpa TaxID=499986 RepID=A0AAE1MQE2_9FABA|nr:hypothetical protein QN277_017361 [Acacia crassicarpa]